MCKHEGTISLIDKAGNILHIKDYKGIKHRDGIVEGWWAIYGYGMNRYYLQISPKIDEDDLDGCDADAKPELSHFRKGVLPKIYKIPCRTTKTHYIG